MYDFFKEMSHKKCLQNAWIVQYQPTRKTNRKNFFLVNLPAIQIFLEIVELNPWTFKAFFM